MGCSACDQFFNEYVPVVASVEKSGTKFHVYVENRAENTILLQRILACRYWDATTGVILFIREQGSGGFEWIRSSRYLEAGTKALFYTIDDPQAIEATALVDYVEISGHARSCTVTSGGRS